MEDKYIENFESEVVKKLQIQVNKINKSENKIEKYQLCIKLFNMLLDIQVINKIVNNNPGLKQTLFEKALEFMTQKECPELVKISRRFIRKIGYDKNTIV